jgi:Phosphotransferase enzyme family
MAGLDSTAADLIRDGSNVMYRLAGPVVARIGRPGSRATAEREIRVSQWLSQVGVAATRPLADVEQPIMVGDRPVTWWELLPEHRTATPAELGVALRALHALPVPDDLTLPLFDPFADLDQRIAQVTGISHDDLAWLADHLAALRDRYDELRLGTPRHVIHGDAWQGNVVVPEHGALILVDLEHMSVGHREWDLVPLAVDHVDFARLTADDYGAFVRAYGHDVTIATEFRVLAGIQELRWVCFVLSKSDTSSAASQEAQHRIACLRGQVPRPWSWTAF